MSNKLIILVFCTFTIFGLTASAEEENTEEYLDSAFWGALIYAKNGKSESTVARDLEIKLKKALYLIKISRDNEGKKLLDEIISDDSIWKEAASEISKF